MMERIVSALFQHLQLIVHAQDDLHLFDLIDIALLDDQRLFFAAFGHRKQRTEAVDPEKGLLLALVSRLIHH